MNAHNRFPKTSGVPDITQVPSVEDRHSEPGRSREGPTQGIRSSDSSSSWRGHHPGIQDPQQGAQAASCSSGVPGDAT